MTTIINQITSASGVICQNIEHLNESRGLLAQNVLAQLRNIVEPVLVLLHSRNPDNPFSYPAIAPAIQHVKSRNKHRFLILFHDLLQKSASHYSMEEDPSERLLLKYYEYLFRLRKLLKDEFHISVLHNLESIPLNRDEATEAYYAAIARRIDSVPINKDTFSSGQRFYIHRKIPFFVDENVYYELTFSVAINSTSKSDHLVAFTSIDINDRHSVLLSFQRSRVKALDSEIPILLIDGFQTSIRPCEFTNLARIFGMNVRLSSNASEYIVLMRYLTDTRSSLLAVVDAPDVIYNDLKRRSIARGTTKFVIFNVLDKAREIIGKHKPGAHVLQYLIYRMRNRIIKPQIGDSPCAKLSGLRLKYGCIPFDSMPFCTSLIGHNPRYFDLITSLESGDYTDQLFARKVNSYAENRGHLYVDISSVKKPEIIGNLIDTYNNKLYYKHVDRSLILDGNKILMKGYEDDTAAIIKDLVKRSAEGLGGYSASVVRWLKEHESLVDDKVKRKIMMQLLVSSKVAVIYGAAGTGKTTLMQHIAEYFSEQKKLFVAQTHPAVTNLRRRIHTKQSDFRTVTKQIRSMNVEKEYDVVFVDECSTVSNRDFLSLIQDTRCGVLILVGDVYQIESIRFGNWFEMVRNFLKTNAVFELTVPYRTKNTDLVKLWNSVRNVNQDIDEILVKVGYSRPLKELFDSERDSDEILLCLNYDGIYGINNINRILQQRNRCPSVEWGMNTFKEGDPILFEESRRFGGVIYNNLKGTIKRIEVDTDEDRIVFDVEIDRPVNEFDVIDTELKLIADSVIQFSVDRNNNTDEDDDSMRSVVPFRVAYAVSIHKAQGLEYDSVKIVVTDLNEELITHNVFYTAITRARKKLQIFWSPEVQRRVIARLQHKFDRSECYLLAHRKNLKLV